MMTIFIGTDFSPASLNASEYAISMAQYFEAKLILFHAYSLCKQNKTRYKKLDNYKSYVLNRLQREAQKLNPAKRVPMEICISEGDAAYAMIKMAREKNADIIVCSTKMGNVTTSAIFGTTSMTLTGISEIPLFMVPQYQQFKTPEKISETGRYCKKSIEHYCKSFIGLAVTGKVENNVSYQHRYQPSGFYNFFKTLTPNFEFTANSYFRSKKPLLVVPHQKE